MCYKGEAMKTFLKYEKNKIFITLTIILSIFILILIRECDYPLMINNSIFCILFVHSYSEKLLYNISISYIAAYIFYIIQVYIPLTLKNKNAINVLRNSIFKQIYYLKYALCILDASVNTRNDGVFIKQNLESSLYISIKKENLCYLRRFSYGETLKQLEKSTTEVQNAIFCSHCLHELDPYIARLLTNLPIENLFKMLEHINSRKNDKNMYMFKDNNVALILQQQIDELECIPQLASLCTCTVNYDSSLHTQYDNELLSNNWDEYQCTINI